MTTLAFIFIFCLGLIIGSFLNVVIYRFNTGKTLGGRSICMSCNHTLSWYELVPVLSFLMQFGRCRTCAVKISHQYPIVEFVTGAIFALLAFHFWPTLSISQSSFIFLLSFFSLIFSILIVIAVYDIRHKIIPDTLVYTFIFLSFISMWVNHTGSGVLFTQPDLWAFLAGPIYAIPFAFLWLVSGGRWMGLGDAKLILGLGFLLGLSSGGAALTLSFWLGTIISLGIMLFTHSRLNAKTEIPFAPFLIASMLIVILLNLNIFSLSALFAF